MCEAGTSIIQVFIWVGISIGGLVAILIFISLFTAPKHRPRSSSPCSDIGERKENHFRCIACRGGQYGCICSNQGVHNVRQYC